MDPKKATFLFDSAGRPYRFASKAEIADHQVDARTCPGFATDKASAPPEVAQQRPKLQTDEVSGRHLTPDSEFYHTNWEWGVLEFDGQEELVGSYFCCHAHCSPVDARAAYDPSCDMISMDMDELAADDEEFVSSH